ncbi:SRPBCC family protein [Amycolatopsis anabasis]|uniref:SRPBCC family protein n=1 Tax=Amycolatopsis anabasis TaxID=1840409 RepID=UPI00131DD724|nr:SRPBCC family protein [Amycolatopsis anabasis]
MTEYQATLDTIAGKPVLRFERRLQHPPSKVWRAVTDPAELKHWFPAAVETELKPGAKMRFVFPDEAPIDATSEGEVLEFDPPKVFAFRWMEDVLRFELVPDGGGCLLVFTQSVGGGWIGGLAAGRNAIGWDVCLAGLEAFLADRSFEQPAEWLAPMERYIAKFGLDKGEVRSTPEGYEIFFARDLVWKPVTEVWSLLTEEGAVERGAEPPLPATNGYVPAGPVTEAEAPRVLEYAWLHECEPAGRVRWEIHHDPELGTRVELTQTLPTRLADLRATALAAWHVQLELFFAATHGEIRCPWPEARTEELRRHYTDQLAE